MNDINNVYGSLYDIERPESGSYTLVIRSMNAEIAGLYECIDNAGFGERRPAELLYIGECTMKSEISACAQRLTLMVIH